MHGIAVRVLYLFSWEFDTETADSPAAALLKNTDKYS